MRSRSERRTGSPDLEKLLDYAEGGDTGTSDDVKVETTSVATAANNDAANDTNKTMCPSPERRSCSQDIENLPCYTEVEDPCTTDVEVGESSASTPANDYAIQLAQQRRALKAVFMLEFVQFLVASWILLFKYDARPYDHPGAIYVYLLMIVSFTILITIGAVSWHPHPYVGAVAASVGFPLIALFWTAASRCSAEVLSP